MKILSLLFCFSFVSVFAQEEIINLPVSDGPKPGEDEIFNIVEEQPEFPGGLTKMMEFIQKNFEYPAIAKENKEQGSVFVQFVIEKDGSVSSVSVVKGVSKSLDAECMRVVKAMPKWTPGKQKGKPIRARFTLPIKCKLNDSDTDKSVYVRASFPGGYTKKMEFINKEMKYPAKALKYGETGVVYLGFDISAEGKVSNVKIKSGVNPELDQEAIRIVKTFPDYVPAKKDGKNVESSDFAMIRFNLDEKAIKKGQKLKKKDAKKK